MFLGYVRTSLGLAGVLGLFCLVGCSGSGPGKTAEDILQPFSGEWTIVSLNRSGKQVSSAGLKDIFVTLDKGKLTLIEEKGPAGGGGGISVRQVFSEEFALQVDPAKPEGQIDLAHANGDSLGLVRPGIYEFAENQLKLCYAEPGRPRPTQMAPGEKLVLLVLARKQ